MTELRANRSKIHQVISGARASLNEPSRPYTPPSLDQRMSVDSHSSRASNSTNGMLKPSRVNGLLKSIQLSSDTNKYSNEYRENDNSTEDNIPPPKVRYDVDHQSLKSLILDIKDSIDLLNGFSNAVSIDNQIVCDNLKSLYTKVDLLVPILVQKNPVFINDGMYKLSVD